MKIGIFTDTYYPETNGVATSVYQLKKELENRGNTVYIFTVSNPYMTEKEENVYRIRSIPFVLLTDRRMSYSPVIKWTRIIKKLQLDVIHTQTEFTIGHIGRKVAKKLDIPLLHTYHTIYEDYTHYLKIPGNQNLKGIVRSLSRYCCDKADKVIVPTDKVKKLLVQYGVKKPIVIQPTGIDVEKFDKKDYAMIKNLKIKYGLTPQNHVFISVGRLAKEKNLEELIKYTKKSIETDKQIRLLIVGGGPETDRLKTYVKEEHLEQYVIFTGEVKWKDIQNYYALGDVFVSASTSETQGLTYIEALAAGKPLLVRQDECLENVLISGINGFSYTDLTSFLEGCQKLFNSKLYLNMENNAIQSANKASMSNFGEQMEIIYTKTCMSDSVRKEEESYEQIHSVAG